MDFLEVSGENVTLEYMKKVKTKEFRYHLAPPVYQSVCKEPSHPMPIDPSPKSHEVGMIVIPMVQVRNWKPRKVKKLIQGHTANK